MPDPTSGKAINYGRRMEFTGERFVPGAESAELFYERDIQAIAEALRNADAEVQRLPGLLVG